MAQISQYLKKGILALLLIVLLIPTASASTFGDVASSNSNYVAIEYLVSIGTLEGYSDGTFKPNQTINRAELMKILVAGQGIDPDENTYKNCFPDVTTDWYAKYVCYAHEQGWVDGYPDGTFQPATTVNKVEEVKMLVNALGLSSMLPSSVSTTLFTDTDSSAWYAPYLYVAKDLNLLEISSGSFRPSGDMDRSGVAENIYRTLVVQEMDVSEFSEESQTAFLTQENLTSLISSDDSNDDETDDEVTDSTDDIEESDPSTSIDGIELSGSGAEVSDPFQLEEGLSVITLTHSGDSNFIVRVLSTSDDDTEYLVNEIGDYDGVTAFGVDATGEYVLDIDADGPWTATIEQPRDTSEAEYTKSFSGEGMMVTDFIKVEEGLAVFNFTHDGDSNFIVHLLDDGGDVVGYLANQIGEYEGSIAEYVDEGTYVVCIDADGEWTMDFDQVDFDESTSDTSFSGEGNTATQVFHVGTAGLKTFDLSHSGDSNFIVHLLDSDGDTVAYLANAIGDYSGSTAEYLDAGDYIMNVQADGDWDISIE